MTETNTNLWFMVLIEIFLDSNHYVDLFVSITHNVFSLIVQNSSKNTIIS